MNPSLLNSISFTLISILAIYIANYREGNYFAVWIFWLCLIMVILLIFYQALLSNNQSKHSHLFVILQILMLSFLIRILFISRGDTLAGYDAYNEVLTLYNINSLNRWEINQINGYGATYPILYFFGIIWSQILGVNLLMAAKWMPISFFFISPLFIYLIGSLKYSKMAGLFAFIGFSFLYISLFFHTTFQRETIALPMMLMTIYLYYKKINLNSSKVIYTLLAISTSVVCIFSHHLTPFILLLFFAFLYLTDFLVDIKKYLKINCISRYTIRKENISLTFLILFFTIILGYWIYLKYTPLNFIALILNESAINNPGTGASISNILRIKLLLVGEILFAILFASISIYGLLLMNTERKSTDIAILLYSLFVGILMVLTLSGHLIRSEGMGLGSRFQTFVYIGFFVLSSNTFSNSLNKNMNYLKKILTLILILFVVFNVYRIPPYLYSEQNIPPGEVYSLISSEEFAAAKFLGLGRDEVISSDTLNGALQYSKYFGGNGKVKNLNIYELNSREYVIHSNIIPYQTHNYIYNKIKLYDNGISSIYCIQI